VVVETAIHEWLLANPGVTLSIDVERAELELPDGSRARFPLESFARYCLLQGVDETGYLLSQLAAIEVYERRNPA
jgi:3-isopropylmalate/(R)-2-methylmalate dehydratase small subunit